METKLKALVEKLGNIHTKVNERVIRHPRGGVDVSPSQAASHTRPCILYQRGHGWEHFRALRRLESVR